VNTTRPENLNLPLEDVRELCRRYHVQELSIFGSVARGEATASSDIDLLVEFEPSARVGLITFNELAEELTCVFHRHVDLVSKRGLKPLIREQVLHDAEVIFAA
jgi:hypothetical protein